MYMSIYKKNTCVFNLIRKMNNDEPKKTGGLWNVNHAVPECRHMGMGQAMTCWGILGGWTSINPSYFAVHQGIPWVLIFPLAPPFLSGEYPNECRCHSGPRDLGSRGGHENCSNGTLGPRSSALMKIAATCRYRCIMDFFWQVSAKAALNAPLQHWKDTGITRSALIPCCLFTRSLLFLKI